MERYAFPGFPIFLHRAAIEIGCMEAERPAHRMTTFTAMANLCAQAGSADSKDALVILAKAIEFRDQLQVAHRAADLMLEEIRNAILEAKSTIEENPAVMIQTRKSRK